MLHLALIEMGTIFHGNQSPHGFVHNVGKRFLQKMKSIIFKKRYRKLIMKQWY